MVDRGGGSVVRLLEAKRCRLVPCGAVRAQVVLLLRDERGGESVHHKVRARQQLRERRQQVGRRLLVQGDVVAAVSAAVSAAEEDDTRQKGTGGRRLVGRVVRVRRAQPAQQLVGALDALDVHLGRVPAPEKVRGGRGTCELSLEGRGKRARSRKAVEGLERRLERARRVRPVAAHRIPSLVCI